jgi:hypothetical protein
MPSGGKIFVGDTDLLEEIEALSGLDATELGYLDGVTAGTVIDSKAVVVDTNKDVGDFRNVDAVNLDAGASGTAGTVDVFPTTASKGKLAITAADSAGDTTTTVVNASQSGARTYTIPDAGASASFVMSEGAQTVNGAKTFNNTVNLLTATGLGTPGAGVTAVEHGDGSFHRTILTLAVTDAFTIDDTAALADGYLVYTFPAGKIAVHSATMSIGVTAASTEAQSDTPDVGLGTTIGSGGVATLDGTPGFENILTGQTASDANGTDIDAAVNTTLFIAAAGDHTVHVNIADTWANDSGGDLTADLAGTVILEWSIVA